jgi:Protein of unknown function (DUF1573)
MKTKIGIIFGMIFLLCSCQTVIKEDKKIKELKAIPQTEYTVIECPFEINMDTVTTDKINLKLPIKNIGKKDLKKLYIETTCDCTALENYPKTLKPNQKTFVNIAIDLENKGYFSKSIIVYGTFNPLARRVNIVGYKK